MPDDRPPADPDKDIWRIVAEDFRDQLKVFGDSINGGLEQLRQEIHGFHQDTNVRLDTLEAAVRRNSTDIRQNSTDIRTLTSRVDSLDDRVAGLSEQVEKLDARVEKLEAIEERVTVLEQDRRGR